MPGRNMKPRSGKNLSQLANPLIATCEPLVSIILPNLNTAISFLDPRIDSILDQEYKNWECIVIDGFSTNGSWEYILEKTGANSRFSHYQKPANGIYDAWNEGIKLATGEFIHIATSDDTCDPMFLREMVEALTANPDCDMAHCCLNIIDEDGNLTETQWRDWEKVKFYGDFIRQYHKRVAPHDAIVHFGWSTVYTSTTQLLIKRTLFIKTGYFNTHFGSIADYQWGLCASLQGNLIHVPQYLASWRKHDAQATKESYINSSFFYADLMQMADELAKNPKFRESFRLLDLRELYFNYFFQAFNSSIRLDKIKVLARHLKKMPGHAAKIVWYWLIGKRSDTGEFLKKNLVKRGLSEGLVLIK